MGRGSVERKQKTEKGDFLAIVFRAHRQLL
jgi:hypothetical protein